MNQSINNILKPKIKKINIIIQKKLSLPKLLLKYTVLLPRKRVNKRGKKVKKVFKKIIKPNNRKSLQ